MFKLMHKLCFSCGIENTRIANNILSRSNCSVTPSAIEKTINTIKLLGRVGYKPLQRGDENFPVVTFTMATHSSYMKPTGGYGERVDWHRIIVFRPKLREFTKNYITKGQRVLIYGRLSYSDIIDNEGNTRIASTIVADDIICLV